MDFERLRFSEVLARVDPEEAEAAVYRVASKAGITEFVGIFGGPAWHRPWSQCFRLSKCPKSVGTRLVD
jgi:hypothetical protein